MKEFLFLSTTLPIFIKNFRLLEICIDIGKIVDSTVSISLEKFWEILQNNVLMSRNRENPRAQKF